ALTLTMHYSNGDVASVLPFSIPSPCPIGPSVPYSGSLLTGDSTQTARLGRNFASTCSGKGCPGASGSGLRSYADFGPYTDATAAPECINVSLTPNCANNTVIQSIAYLGSFTGNVCTNYLGDWGNPGGGAPNVAGAYSFEIQPAQQFIVHI